MANDSQKTQPARIVFDSLSADGRNTDTISAAALEPETRVREASEHGAAVRRQNEQ